MSATKTTTKLHIFKYLREALIDAKAYKRGEDMNLRVTKMPQMK